MPCFNSLPWLDGGDILPLFWTGCGFTDWLSDWLTGACPQASMHGTTWHDPTAHVLLFFLCSLLSFSSRVVSLLVWLPVPLPLPSTARWRLVDTTGEIMPRGQLVLHQQGGTPAVRGARPRDRRTRGRRGGGTFGPMAQVDRHRHRRRRCSARVDTGGKCGNHGHVH